VNFLYRITYIDIIKNLILEWVINKKIKYKVFNSYIVVVEQEWLHTYVEEKSWFEFASVQNLPRIQHI
jgi:DNA integrity scanning protein DisA with diadenylate cyclase activity